MFAKICKINFFLHTLYISTCSTLAIALTPQALPICMFCGNGIDSPDHLVCLINCNCEYQSFFQTHSLELCCKYVLHQPPASSHPSIILQDALTWSWSGINQHVCIKTAGYEIVMRCAFFICTKLFLLHKHEIM